MNPLEIHVLENQKETLERFIETCKEDDRILAAFIAGSYATHTTDKFSDLDLFFITTDESYEDFLASKESFIRLLGEPLFLEDFSVRNGLLTIYSNGTEADIFFGPERSFKDLHHGPFTVLLDKKGLLARETFPPPAIDLAKQVDFLRKQIDWFWHDLSHFIKAMGRKQLWFAHGELEIIRQCCVNLARFKYNFSDPYVTQGEPYFKVETIVPIEELAPLEKTICPMEYGAMLQAALDIFRFYQAVAPALASAHDLTYQVRLEKLMYNQLIELDTAG